MYPIGVPIAVDAFLASGLTTWLVVAILTLCVLILVIAHPKEKDDNAPPILPGWILFNIWRFFNRRFDFLNSGFPLVGEDIFQFKLLHNTVIVVSGHLARETFFNTKGFNLTEGFKVLSGAIPMVPGVTSDLQIRRINLIHKRLAAVQRTEALGKKIPAILNDCRRAMETWGTSGIFDPFVTIYELLFQCTVRSLSCSEIADDSTLVARLKLLYDMLDEGTTPSTVLLPWLPTYSMLKKLWATKEIYEIVLRAINAREKSGMYQDDTLQMLLDCNDEHLLIIGFIMGLLMAGARATGTSASWLIAFLGAHPEWKSKAKAEIEQLLEKHLLATDGSYPAQSLSARLSLIPLEEWESRTPVLDSVIHETLRIAQPHAAMRRNIGKEVYISGKIIPTGAYVLYPFSDVHLNPELYPDPWSFDPERSCRKKTTYSYIGWGAGPTVCLGQRLAKLELKLMSSMFLLGFNYAVVDRTGTLAAPLSNPNWNDTLLCRPSAGSCYLKFEKSKNPL